MVTKREIYDTLLRDKVGEIFDLCKEHKINMFTLFQLDDTEVDGKEGTHFCHSLVVDETDKEHLAPEIMACVEIANGGQELAVATVIAAKSISDDGDPAVQALAGLAGAIGRLQ